MGDSKPYKELMDSEAKKRADGTVYPVLTEDEKSQRDRDIVRLQDAKGVRDGYHIELNGMNYLDSYEASLRADMAYIPPKLNEGDVRVVTGITREKDNTLLSALLNYNFEASVTAYTQDGEELADVAQGVEAMVRKSRELEEYDMKRDLIYRELIAVGDVFTVEEWIQEQGIERTARFDWKNGVKFSSYESSSKLVDLPGYACTKQIPGTKVYKANIREANVSSQPFIFTVEVIHYDEGRNRFGNWERWVNVPKHIVRSTDGASDIPYRDWTILDGTRDSWIEIVKVYDKPNQTFQMYLNGVPMLPCDFPLTEVSPSGEYPIVQGSCERSPFFAYSKGMPSKTFVEQAVIDEMLKLAVLKTQQSFRPPMANMTGFELSPEIFLPGYISDAATPLDPSKLAPLMSANGVTQSEMNMMDYMKGILDLKTISPSFSSEGSSQDVTATQYQGERKAALMKLGLVVWGVVQFEQNQALLRVNTILEYWGKDADKARASIRRFSYNGQVENGRQGKQVYDVSGNLPSHPDQQMLEEELLSVKNQMPTRITYLDVDAIRAAKLVFRVNITPTEKETTELEQQLFIKNLTTAAQLFGPQALNMDYAKTRYAEIIGEDPQKFFAAPPQQQMQPGQMATPGSAVPQVEMQSPQQPQSVQSSPPANVTLNAHVA